ncbi:Zn(II)2Cys6 transcription factor domain-containing protein [Aspergillus mulundensis]|uniref:Zn(2)-C6 fungal-type domain-containing protein n=1 Tax=Aspergillus mulundensis TaxID=1810919 RepID=A0A3D8SUP9_9EURO|nr:hypothetical protein DSM5745_01676 [Aspergillus mulundensis]RDW89901.1 hypothetical protein DSM5745_01676 [Aspergillus mulundensis]
MVYRRQPPKRYACTRCVRHKVKCVPVAGGSACQRCIRLGHPACVFPAEMRGNPSTAASTPASNDTNEHDKNEENGKEHGRDLTGQIQEIISPDQTTTLFRKYIEQKQPHFPFVIISLEHEADIQVLREQYPFLILCVLTASMEHNPAAQERLEGLVRKEIATRLVVKLERNMDLLMGLLVHAAWYHYHWRSYHTQMYMLLQMAVMVVGDLGLDRQHGFRMQTIPVNGKELDHDHTALDACRKETRHQPAQSAAGKRALLGCYYLCSTSSLFRRQLYMRHTPWVNQCAAALAERAEYPTDARLKTYIDVHVLVRQSQLLFDEERQYLDSVSDGPYIREQITELRTQQRALTETSLGSLGSDTCKAWQLRIEIGGATALILGQALSGQQHVFKLQEMNQLEALTESAHHVVDTFLAAPVSVAAHLSAPAYATIWYCLLVLSKLSILFHPNEHRAIGVDKKRIHDIGVAIMAKFKELAPENGKENFWARSSNVIANMLAWLQRSNGNASGNSQPISVGHDTLGKPGSDASQDHEPKSSLAQQAVWQSAGSPGNIAPMDMWLQPVDAFDPSLWQQMLDNFTWFGPVAGDSLGFDHHGI